MSQELPRIMLSHELRDHVRYSDMHLRRLEAAGKFPVRFKISSDAQTGRVGWWRHQVEAWLRARGQQRAETPKSDQSA